MEKCRGNKKQAAAELGISRSYLYKRLGELGIT
ncbi:helix-turn-helix domain-containing protein [Hydrogenophaga sp. ANAO-22]